MGRRTKRQYCDTPINVTQDSPFLLLPGEIRTRIYYACLVKPTPIDLWPNEYIEDALSNPLLRARIEKRPPQYYQYITPKFRRQNDLKFVRQELSTGFLATCKQVFNEASAIFWSENVFCFSSDIEWLGIRRFLSTIGPRAISQLTTIEVFAPLVEASCFGTGSIGSHSAAYITNFNDNRGAKNEPKMHMAKAGGPWAGASQRLLANESYLSRNAEHIHYLLSASSARFELRFLMTRDFGLNEEWGWPSRGNGDRLRKEVCLPDEIIKICQRYTKRVKLVVEADAYINSLEVIKDFTREQIDVVFQPGSIFKAVPDDEATEIMEEKKFEADWELEKLFGVAELYEEPQKISIAARGGKANKTPGKRKTARVLKAFGPNRFIARDGFDCSCGKTGVYVAGPECDTCGRYSYREERTVVELKRLGRAVRKGYVNGRMVSLGSRRFEEETDD